MVSRRRATNSSITARRRAPSASSRPSSASGTRRRTSVRAPSSRRSAASRTSSRRASARSAVSSAGEGRLGGARQRAGDAAGLDVPGQGQHPVATPLPGADERAGQQRQRRRLPVHVPDHGVDQVGIDAQAGCSRRLLDHLAQLRLGHRRHQDEPVGGAAGQLDVLGEPTQVVAPHHQHGATEQTVVEHRQQRVDEGGPLPRRPRRPSTVARTGRRPARPGAGPDRAGHRRSPSRAAAERVRRPVAVPA